MNVLVTGAAGFIGYHVTQRLLAEGHTVLGVDNLSDHYDPSLKRARLDALRHSRFHFTRGDIAETDFLTTIFESNEPEWVIHLAAQVSVRRSVTTPHIYIRNNVLGFLNVLECCRHHPVQHLIYASSSSVYGANPSIPFSVREPQTHPLSLYAATKGSNELMAHSYSHLFGIPATGLRFFTVYGPWGRPDMALFLFTKAAYSGDPIQLFNHGELQRDFTYVDDAVEGVLRLLEQPPTPQARDTTAALNPSSSWALTVCSTSEMGSPFIC